MKEHEIFSGNLECLHKVLQLGYTPDGKKIVAIMKSVEQKKNGEKVCPQYKLFIYARFSPNDKFIVATSEHVICIYDSSTGALINKHKDQSMHFTCSVFSPDSSQIAAGTEEGNVCVWETSSLIQENIN